MRWRASRRWSATYNQLVENGTSSPYGLCKKEISFAKPRSKAGHGNLDSAMVSRDPSRDDAHGAERRRSYSAMPTVATLSMACELARNVHITFGEPASTGSDSSILSVPNILTLHFLNAVLPLRPQVLTGVSRTRRVQDAPDAG
jgi:hypothetical protein